MTESNDCYCETSSCTCLYFPRMCKNLDSTYQLGCNGYSEYYRNVLSLGCPCADDLIGERAQFRIITERKQFPKSFRSWLRSR